MDDHGLLTYDGDGPLTVAHKHMDAEFHDCYVDDNGIVRTVGGKSLSEHAFEIVDTPDDD